MKVGAGGTGNTRHSILEDLEKEAREAKKGLWLDPASIPPWAYRKTRPGQSLDLSDEVPFEARSLETLRILCGTDAQNVKRLVSNPIEQYLF